MDGDPLLEALGELRAGDAARERSRGRWLRRQAEEGAHLAGALLDLAEQQATVVVRTTAGRTIVGVLVTVGSDFCALRGGDGATTVVALDALAVVQMGDGAAAAPATGVRRPADVGLADVLGRLADGGCRVTAYPRGPGAPVGGELRAVGADVVTLATGDGRGPTAYVRLASISEISFRESG